MVLVYRNYLSKLRFERADVNFDTGSGDVNFIDVYILFNIYLICLFLVLLQSSERLRRSKTRSRLSADFIAIGL